MFPFALMLALAGGPSASSGEYDFYINEIKRGFSRYEYKSSEQSKGGRLDRLTVEGDSGFGASSAGSIDFAGKAPTKVDFRVNGANPAGVQYTTEAGKLRRVGAAADPVMGAFYYPTQPILLQRLLDEYPAGAHSFVHLHAADLLTGKPRDISAELYKTETRTIAGKPVRLRMWRLLSDPTPDAVIYTDETNRPVFWWVPARQFEIVLKGYEELRPSAPYEKDVSPAAYKAKVEMNVWVTMRDGVRLMADVYRPDAEGKFPVLLQRTCYDRSEFGNDDGEFYAQRGYVYVTQHVRGRGGSEGEFTPFLQESNDGSDSVAWCASQPWSSGDVGMLGASYNGYCEWMAARTRPAALKTMISTVAMAGPPDGAPWVDGTHFAWNELSWFGLLRDKAKTQLFTDDMTQSQNTLPLTETDQALFGHHIPAYQYWLNQDRLNDAVKLGAYRDDIAKIDLPVLHVSSWLDGTSIGTRLNYLQMVAAGHKNQKIVWGPWDHFSNRESIVGLRDFGPEAYIDIKMLYLRWFDRWLKGRHNGIDTEPSVSTYLLGEHRWEQSDGWPSKSMVTEKWYLDGPKSAGKPGVLSREAPKARSPERYAYDPAKSVYSAANPVSFFFAMLGAADAAPLCATADGDRLVYDSPPLTKPMRLCGLVRGTLCAASSARDTDWVMALFDVFPDGTALTIGSGMVRARFRDSLEQPKLLEPGRDYKYDIDMWQTGVAIPAGHRLRVVVCSTMFPDRDRNLNTGESIASGTRMVTAEQTIFHDPAHLTFVELPVLPAPAGPKAG